MAKKPVKYSVVDAFTDKAFKGNPAAVCLLEDPREEEWLQAVATEFNLSETCYLTPISDAESLSGTPRFGLRWFTPVAEVELCGHATLAASYFLFSNELVKSDKIEFLTQSGVLTAKKFPENRTSNPVNEPKGNYLIELDFPAVPIAEINSVDVLEISKSLNGAAVVEVQKTAGDDLFVVLPSAKAVAEVAPQFDEIRRCPGRGMVITGPASPESGFDFYSRFFCPKLGINEDPVTGSLHCSLAVYWSKKLGKSDFIAYQASPRGGVINIQMDEKNERVLLRGKAVVVAEGVILVDAFTGEAFKGNPALVCSLEDTKDDQWLQAVASELNIPSTAYVTPVSMSPESTIPRFGIRWFTPVTEVKLCGHATLAASHFLFSYGIVQSDIIEFSSHSGVLTAKKISKTRTSITVNECHDQDEDFLIELDFPLIPIADFNSVDISQISKSLNGASVVEVHKTTNGEDLLVVLPSAKAVVEVQPQFDEIKRCPGRAMIITGAALPESEFDFYSRVFSPKLGIDEDPVTGSVHCALGDYWSKKLGKSDFVAYQASPRGGVINLHLDEKNERVLLRGKAVIVTEGSILV
ncbi:OLC1v1007355C1 [Oldenlandia corymbosa var. corymbosa]|uniref:OLC1v1007355C1 n=1 Tax=Oldenlandia corymbosa var. corymbosa TaxID=529605 RepID=A0AAV1DKJ8_OLDCO|nr:OLC1v1007355C1 [Oldenlandia corymbosa var. corymbosa]